MRRGSDDGFVARRGHEERIWSSATCEVLVHFVDETGAEIAVIEVLEQRPVSAGLGPAWNKRGCDAGSGSGVGVLAGRDLHACFAGVVDNGDDIFALAPNVGPESFDVRDHHRKMCFFADVNGLAN